MESRFSKYENNGKTISDHIANINSFIDYNFSVGLDLVEAEVQDLQKRIDAGNAPAIFSNKKDLLIEFGKSIEKLHETYHFNKDN